jgi:Ohr subfamily peroxiredoxin
MKIFLERKATTQGGRDGRIFDTASGLELQLSKPVEMGGTPNKNTNPEEIFSVGYSSCFASSLEFLLQNSETTYEDISVTVNTKLVPDGQSGFKFQVEVTARVKGLDKNTEKAFIDKAYHFCPYSKAIQGNVEVTFK